MSPNPMQKKAMNSFLLGFFSMLIIAVLIGGIIFFITRGKNKNTNNEEKKPTSLIYALVRDIDSGAEVTPNDVKIVEIDKDLIPTDAYTTNDIYGEDGFYREVVNNDGELESVPRFRAKISLKKGTVISEQMLYEGNGLDSTERIVEYNMLQLPVQLDIGEYIDVRFTTSLGQDFVVISHKEVIDISDNTVWLKLNELEIELMTAAIVDSYMTPYFNMYVTKYVEPGMQAAQITTYAPSGTVKRAIEQNPNLIQEAIDNYTNRYTPEAGNFLNRYDGTTRAYIESQIGANDEETRIDNLQNSILESREKAREERQTYLYGVQ